MKNAIISPVVILACFAFHLQAQQTPMIAGNTGAPIAQMEAGLQNVYRSKKQASNFTAVQKVARFEDLEAYVSDHLLYPMEARENGIEGTVKVLVELSPEGNVTNAQIMQSLGYGCDEAALNMTKNMPPWKPSMRNGRPVRTKVVMSVAFQLTL